MTSVPGSPVLLDEGVANEVAYDFAAILGDTAPGNQVVEAHEQFFGHGDGKPNEIPSVDMTVSHSCRLHEIYSHAGSVGSVFFQGVFRISEKSACLVEQLLHRVKLIVDRREPSVPGLMGQPVGPAPSRAIWSSIWEIICSNWPVLIPLVHMGTSLIVGEGNMGRSPDAPKRLPLYSPVEPLRFSLS